MKYLKLIKSWAIIGSILLSLFTFIFARYYVIESADKNEIIEALTNLSAEEDAEVKEFLNSLSYKTWELNLSEAEFWQNELFTDNNL